MSKRRCASRTIAEGGGSTSIGTSRARTAISHSAMNAANDATAIATSVLPVCMAAGLFINNDAHGGRLEAVARIALLRAVGDADQQVHVGAKVVIVARLAGRLVDVHGSILVGLDVHERQEGVGHVAVVEAPGAERHGEVAAAVRRVRHAVADVVE